MFECIVPLVWPLVTDDEYVCSDQINDYLRCRILEPYFTFQPLKAIGRLHLVVGYVITQPFAVTLTFGRVPTFWNIIHQVD